MPQDTVRVHLPDGRVLNFPAGMSPAEMEQAITTLDAPEEKSLGGFAENAVNSGGRLLRDTAKGLAAIPAFAWKMGADTKGAGDDLINAVKAAPGAITGYVKDRYGSLDKAGNTLYEDPFGAAADVSSVAGIGALSKVPKIAGTLGKIERATNPLSLVTQPAAAVADKLSSGVIRGTLRPSAAVRGDFGGTEGVVDAVKKHRVYSEASAQRKLTDSVSEADQMLADAQAAGTPGVRRGAIAAELRGAPTEKATRRSKIEAADHRPDIRATATAVRKNNPREIPLTDAQALKREAQELAYEAGADNLSVKKAQQQAIARALRTGIENQVPEVGPVNAASQELLGTKRAFAEAQDRPQALSNMMALGAGGTVGAGTGDLLSAAITAGLMKGLNSPRGGAMTGIAINEVGKAGINPELLRAALIARLTGGGQQ